MEDERFLSGYCRKLDHSRTVTVELENGRITCVDCDYGSCPYQSGCPIAAELDKIK